MFEGEHLTSNAEQIGEFVDGRVFVLLSGFPNQLRGLFASADGETFDRIETPDDVRLFKAVETADALWLAGTNESSARSVLLRADDGLEEVELPDLQFSLLGAEENGDLIFSTLDEDLEYSLKSFAPSTAEVRTIGTFDAVPTAYGRFGAGRFAIVNRAALFLDEGNGAWRLANDETTRCAREVGGRLVACGAGEEGALVREMTPDGWVTLVTPDEVTLTDCPAESPIGRACAAYTEGEAPVLETDPPAEEPPSCAGSAGEPIAALLLLACTFWALRNRRNKRQRA